MLTKVHRSVTVNKVNMPFRWLFVATFTLLVGGQASYAGTTIEYYIASKVEAGAGEQAASEEIPEGSGWVADTYRTPSGSRIRIVRQVKPAVSFSLDSIQGIELYAPPWMTGFPSGSASVVAGLDLSDRIESELSRIASEYAGYWLLVESAGRGLALVPVDQQPGAIAPGGAFPSETEAREFYSDIDVSMSLRQWPPHERAEWKSFYKRLDASSLWYVKCDDSFRASLRQDGIDVEKILDEAGGRLSKIDCDGKAPELPAAP